MIRMARTLRRRRVHGGAEAGSAYLVALMAMVVLAILGLSLGFITQTEMLVGSTERNIQRVHYLAESGLSLALSRLLIDDQRGAAGYIFPDVSVYTGAPSNLSMTMVIAPVVPVADPPCDLCGVNDEMEYAAKTYYDVSNVVTIRANLGSYNNAWEREATLAERNLHAIISVVPTDQNFPPQANSDQMALVELAP